jgi:metallo-beta-lactamase class B
MRVSRSVKLAGCAALLLATRLSSQQPPPAPAAPDTPAITATIEAARKAAAPEFTDAVHFWCEAPRANRVDDPPIAPTKILDNVYAIGNTGTTVYVVQTTAGLLMIDALFGNQVETQLLPGFRALGLDPSQVKIVLVTHGHADHFGGAAYFQEKFGSKVYVSAGDWMLMENPPPAPGGRGPAGPPAQIPKHDADIVDGQKISLGDFTVTPVAVPGHTPGAMAFIFPVKDRGATHTAALFGGAWLTPNILSDQALQTFAGSVAKFRSATAAAKVDTLLQNHMLMVPIQDKLDQLGKRRAGERNPFVVGTAAYQKFVDVMAACTNVNLARRKL